MKTKTMITLRACCALVLGASCGCGSLDGVITGSGNSGPSPSRSKSDRDNDESTNGRVVVPMNFSLNFKGPEDIRIAAGKITEDDVARFLSIGTRAIAKEFLVDFSRPEVVAMGNDDFVSIGNNLVRFHQIPKKDLGPNGQSPRNPDYVIARKLTSGWSTILKQTDTNELARAVVLADANAKGSYEYRCRMEIMIEARVYDFRPNTIYFSCSMDCVVEWKPKFADPDKFRKISEAKTGAGELVARAFSKLALDAYVDFFKSYGIDVEKI
jgi:hypothetical protein